LVEHPFDHDRIRFGFFHQETEFLQELAEPFFDRNLGVGFNHAGAHGAKRLDAAEGTFNQAKAAPGQAGVNSEYEHTFDTNLEAPRNWKPDRTNFDETHGA
jgi:hypothetical protein